MRAGASKNSFRAITLRTADDQEHGHVGGLQARRSRRELTYLIVGCN